MAKDPGPDAGTAGRPGSVRSWRDRALRPRAGVPRRSLTVRSLPLHSASRSC